MKLYLAAPWIDKDLMSERAKPFEEAGHTITHRWWEEKDVTVEEEDADYQLYMHAINDLIGVLVCDRLVLFNTLRSEGKAVEQGIALATHKKIVAIGERGTISKNVFHYLPYYTWVNDIERALECLKN